ncbi:UNVERIFIED_CONTAM: hypothetical protein HDU68_005676 [Siphonaria sp. JEL0065]|nr:hypothetical protein HDU68_005676 [Siphonaria sp. JEL0065]
MASTPDSSDPTTDSSHNFATNSAAKEISNALMCPIGWLPFHDPVLLPDGQTYERKAINQWFLKSRAEGVVPYGMATSPVTRQPLYSSQMIPNLAVKNMMAPWSQVQALLDEKDTRIQELEAQLASAACTAAHTQIADASKDDKELDGIPKDSWRLKYELLLRDVKSTVSAYRRKKIARKAFLSRIGKVI